MSEKLKLDSTPLGLAAKAIREATHAIDDAMLAWWDENDGHNDSPGECEVELRPDPDSVGFAALFTFHESSAPKVELIRDKLAPVFLAHGVATVLVACTLPDEAVVEGFEE